MVVRNMKLLIFALLLSCQYTSLQGRLCPTEGRWGTSCNVTCGEGCRFRVCDQDSGQCTDSTGALISGCKVGYVGVLCSKAGCQQPGTWGSNCTKACGDGCPDANNDGYGECDITSGNCVADQRQCSTGYRGLQCADPICQDCNGGTCVAPDLCQLCPVHFASGVTCRNIRFDGLLKGSIPTFGVLAVTVLLLSVCSNARNRRRLKSKRHSVKPPN